MNRNLILWSITVALGGFLFGMDVAVISGAEQVIQQLWHLSEWMHGTAIAIALYGTIVGAIIGSFPANKFGRKKKACTFALPIEKRVTKTKVLYEK